ncbi:VPLPA-CTERM sorting domain-containing protein [Roseobacter insulae]|nr:VPLPA-CTERM sorting domain-containing protein [Roseobacter insulae]
MRLVKTISIALAAIALSGAAHAATFGWTEGLRPDVVGTNRIVPTDANNAPPGFDLGTINGGQSIDLHGRIVDAADIYQFTSKRKFRIDFIFEGFDAIVNGNVKTINTSGFVSQPLDADDGAVVNMFLEDAGGLPGAAAGNSFVTDITSGDSTIFGRTAPGTYTFTIDGLNNFDALYDIRITAVPLPAGGLLLLTALGGLGIARRRRAAA